VSTDYPPFSGARLAQPLLEHFPIFWTLHDVQSKCRAAIWRNDLGVEHGGESIESRLSRVEEGPLLLIARVFESSSCHDWIVRRGGRVLLGDQVKGPLLFRHQEP
jgi:hypothetical protein